MEFYVSAFLSLSSKIRHPVKTVGTDFTVSSSHCQGEPGEKGAKVSYRWSLGKF